MNNLVLRLLTGIVFVSSILFSVWYNIGLFALVMGIYLFGALWEYSRFFKVHQQVQFPHNLFLTTGMLLYLIFALVSSGIIGLPYYIFVLPIIFTYLLLEIWRKKEHPLLNMGAGILGIMYLVIPFATILILGENSYPGNPLVIGMFILIWTNDSFAYLSGRLLGKNPLFPRISPKKTWEGTIGGVLFTIGAALLIAFYLDYRQQFGFWIVSAVIIALCSILGDLLESLIKRSLQIKDSGTILPGHGGILDRFDATLITAPFFFSWYLIYIYFCAKFFA